MIHADFARIFPDALGTYIYDENVVEIGDRLVDFGDEAGVGGERVDDQEGEGGEGSDGDDDDSTAAAPRRVIVLSAAKGMGKSKAIRAMVNRLEPASVLNVTFRRSLARGAAASLGPQSKVYLDEPEAPHFQADTHPVLTILINSLLRVNAKKGGGYKVLILDEWVSILEMLGSDIIDDAKRVHISDLLTEIARGASTIVVSDALLDTYSLVALRKMLDMDVIATDVILLEFLHRNHSDYHYHEHLKEGEWMDELERMVLLQRKRVVVPCMTKSFALKLTERLQKHLPPDRILCYVAGSDHDMVHHMAEIDRVWVGKDVVIYSPVITAGCSFEVRAHFDACFLYAYQGTASVRSAVQMLSRVRDLHSKQIHIYMAKCPQKLLDSDLVVSKLLATNPALDPAISRNLHDATLVMRAVRAVDRVYCFRSAFWKLAARCGVQCHIKSQQASAEEVTELVDRIVGEMQKGGVKPLRNVEMADLFRLGVDYHPHPVWEKCEGITLSSTTTSATSTYVNAAQDLAETVWHESWLKLVAHPEQSGTQPSSGSSSASTSTPPQLVAIMRHIARQLPVILEQISPGAEWTIDPIGELLPHVHPLLRPAAATRDTILYVLTSNSGISREDLFGAAAVRAHLAAALWCIMGKGNSQQAMRIIIANGTLTRFRLRKGVFISPSTALERLIHADRVPIDVAMQPSYLYEYRAEPSGRLGKRGFDKERHIRSRALQSIDPEESMTVLAIRPTDPTIMPISTDPHETTIQALSCGTHVWADVTLGTHKTYKSLLVATTPLFAHPE